MCKFLVQDAQASKGSELLEEKIQKVQALQEENKLLEEKMSKQILDRRSSTAVARPSKLDDLLCKLKKLDEIALQLEQKNKSNEAIIKKQAKTIASLKEKNELLRKMNSEALEERERMMSKIKELEKSLLAAQSSSELLGRSALRTWRNSGFETELESELNQSILSKGDLSPGKGQSRIHCQTTSILNTSMDNPPFRKFQSEILSENALRCSDFSLCRKSSVQSDGNASFLRMLEDAKSKPLYRRKFIYFHQASLLALRQNLGLGRFF